MSIEKARLWLKDHAGFLPAFENHIRQLDQPAEQKKTAYMADVISTDPGLSLALLKKVNANRSPDSGKEIVASTQSAIALLGEIVSRDILTTTPVAEQLLTQPDQLFLYTQIANRSLHSLQQFFNWAKRSGYYQLDDFRLPALLYYTGEALCCCHDYTRYRQYLTSACDADAASRIFGFSFKQLTEACCEQYNLPLLISQAQYIESSKSQQAQILHHVATLCHRSEQGWYSAGMTQDFEQLAESLRLPPDQLIAQFHQNSVDSARNSPLTQAWQAAARLVLTADSAWRPLATRQQSDKQNAAPVTASQKPASSPPQYATPSVPPETAKNPAQHGGIKYAVQRINALIKQPQATQSQVLQACMKGLAADLDLSRVALFLLSPDRQTLQNKLAIGMDKESPFRQLIMPVEQSGLFKILLKKPQAIRIFPGNFKKYAALIPPRLQACNQTQNFLAMSLFIGDKPIAIIYADHGTNLDDINEQDFKYFKQLIAVCAKVLTLLQKKPG